MKSNLSFVLVAILIILLSLGAVAASDDIASDSSNDDLSIADDESLSQDELVDADQNDVDVSVRIDVKNVYDDDNDKFNQPGFTVPWNVTVKVTGGTAHNVKVYPTLSDNMEFLSASATAGEFNRTSGVWDVGDLTGSAILTIVTKLKSGSKFTLAADATTDSNDIKMSNNHKSLYIKSGQSKSTSNITETTDGKTGATYNNYNGDLNRNSKEASKDNGYSPNSNSDSGFNAASGSGGVRSVASIISRTLKPLSSSLADAIDSDSSDDADSNSDAYSSVIHVAGIIAQDYTKIPILIFALFLVIFAALVGYDKIKS